MPSTRELAFDVVIAAVVSELTGAPVLTETAWTKAISTTQQQFYRGNQGRTCDRYPHRDVACVARKRGIEVSHGNFLPASPRTQLPLEVEKISTPNDVTAPSAAGACRMPFSVVIGRVKRFGLGSGLGDLAVTRLIPGRVFHEEFDPDQCFRGSPVLRRGGRAARHCGS